MSRQSGPRDVGAVMESRYWLTEQGMAATEAWWAEQQAQTNEETP